MNSWVCKDFQVGHLNDAIQEKIGQERRWHIWSDKFFIETDVNIYRGALQHTPWNDVESGWNVLKWLAIRSLEGPPCPCAFPMWLYWIQSFGAFGILIENSLLFLPCRDAVNIQEFASFNPCKKKECRVHSLAILCISFFTIFWNHNDSLK